MADETGSTSPSSSSSTHHGRTNGAARGRGLVIALIVLGIAAGAVTYYYWTHFVRVVDDRATGDAAATSPRTMAPREAVDAIGLEFSDAIENGRPVDGPAEAAADLVLRYPDDPAARNLLANILLHRGEWEEAYEQMRISLDHNPNQPEVHLNAGTAAMQLKRYEQAAGHYSQAVGLDQRNARYRVHFAQALIALNRFDEARGLLLAALRADSTMHEAYQGMSELFAKQNELSLAIGQISKAIENTPAAKRDRQVKYIREKANLLRRANQPDDALITLKSLLVKERQDPGVMRELAITYGMLEKAGEAAAMYEAAMAREPAEVRWPIEAARWRIRAGEKEAARRLLDRARTINPAAPGIEAVERDLR